MTPTVVAVSRRHTGARLFRSGAALALIGSAVGLLSLVPAALVSPESGAATVGTIYVTNTAANTITTYPDPASSSEPTASLSTSGALGEPADAALDSAGDLWVSGSDHSIGMFNPGDLVVSGHPAPDVVLTGVPSSVFAFDPDGDLWFLSASGAAEFLPSQIASSGSPTPTTTIAIGTANHADAQGLAFDAAGDMWVVNEGTGTLEKFTPGQLSSSGTPTPVRTITTSGQNFSGVVDLAFDAAGDLWATNAHANTVVEYTTSQLATSGSATPQVTLSGFAAPAGLAFDVNGSLWVTNTTANSVVEFSSAQLGSSGAPTPVDTISGPTSGLSSPMGIAIAKTPLAPAVPTTTTASASPNPATAGAPVTYSATVAPVTPNDNEVTGSVEFLIGSTVLCSTPDLVAGTASCASSGAPVGTDTVQASYTGSPSFRPSSVLMTLAVTAGSGSTSPPPPTSPAGQGYWLVAKDGGIFSFDRPFEGSTGAISLAQPIVGMAETADGGGYWFVARDGGVFAYGDAGYQGSVPQLGIRVNDVVGIVTDHATGGYWVIGADGTVWDFGAPQVGDLPLFGFHVNTIVGGAATPDGAGLYLVSANGRVYNLLGGAHSQGDVSGVALNAPIVSMTIDPATGGYWLLGRDGGVFSFNAPFYGSTGNLALNQPVVGMSSSADGGGYWFVAADGGVFSYGDAAFHGSTGNITLNQPVVGMSGS